MGARARTSPAWAADRVSVRKLRLSAASLARDAAVDPEIRRKTLGHADQAMTSHYTHIEAQAHRAAAEAVASLVEGPDRERMF